MARKALDAFLAHGEAMVPFDLDKFDELVQPRRARWSSVASPLIHPERQIPTITEGTNMAQEKLASTEQVAALNQRLALVEGQVSQIARLASAKMPTENAVKGLRDLVGGLHFYNPGDQAKNDAWYTPGGKVDTVEDHPTYPDALTHPKTASTEGASVAVLNANADLAESILTKLSDTNVKIDRLVTAGRKFDASKAKSDIHKLANEVQTILTNVDLAMPYVGPELHKLASQAHDIHGLFASAKV